MKLFFERFLLPAAAGLFVFLITTKLELGIALRIGASIGVAMIACLVALVAERLPGREAVGPLQSRTILVPGAIIGVAMIAYLVASVAERLPGREAVGPLQSTSESYTTGNAPSAPSQREKEVATPNKADRQPAARSVESLAREGNPPTDSRRQAAPVASEEDIFVKKYLIKDRDVRSNAPRWAILFGGDNATDFPELTSAVTDALSQKGYQRVSVFRPSVIQDRKHEQIYAADPLLSRRLHEYCDWIIVGKVSSALRKDIAPAGLLTVELSLVMRVISTLSGQTKTEFRIHENGAGFTPTEALARAEERLASNLRERLQTIVD